MPTLPEHNELLDGYHDQPPFRNGSLRQVLCLQQHKVLLAFGPSLRMNAGPRRALPGSPGFGSQKVAHPAQKPLLRSTAVSSQSLHFCPGKIGGAAQHMIRRNSKLLSALMIVTQWVFFAPPSRGGRHCTKGRRAPRGGGVSWDFLFTVGSVSQDMDKNDGKVV